MTAHARNLASLTARPTAHRGLHDRAKGVIENSFSAAKAAIAGGYAIECDVQLSSDGELVVFHDDSLERLTEATGLVSDLSTRDLTAIRLRDSADAIPTLSDFLSLIDGHTPLVVELKSTFDGDLRAARRAAELLAPYAGPVVIESFDPAFIACLRKEGDALGVAHIPLGIVGEAAYDSPEWAALSPAQRAEMTHFLHYPRTRPDFLSWNVSDFPNAIPLLLREGLRLPVTVWTVRSREQATRASAWADQIVFEGFSPEM
jgi:glycerophosphoryl diester phosphodiesterase